MQWEEEDPDKESMSCVNLHRSSVRLGFLSVSQDVENNERTILLYLENEIDNTK